MNKKNLLSFLFLILSTNMFFGQNIIRSSINCFGNSISVGNVLFRQTGGQSSNTESFSNGMVLRQGFQQPVSSPVQPFSKNNISVELYPNPASTQTNLVVKGNLNNYEIVITSIAGTELSRTHSDKASNIIECEKLPAGMYIVSVVKENELCAAKKLIIAEK